MDVFGSLQVFKDYDRSVFEDVEVLDFIKTWCWETAKINVQLIDRKEFNFLDLKQTTDKNGNKHKTLYLPENLKMFEIPILVDTINDKSTLFIKKFKYSKVQSSFYKDVGTYLSKSLIKSKISCKDLEESTIEIYRRGLCVETGYFVASDISLEEISNMYLSDKALDYIENQSKSTQNKFDWSFKDSENYRSLNSALEGFEIILKKNIELFNQNKFVKETIDLYSFRDNEHVKNTRMFDDFLLRIYNAPLYTLIVSLFEYGVSSFLEDNLIYESENLEPKESNKNKLNLILLKKEIESTKKLTDLKKLSSKEEQIADHIQKTLSIFYKGIEKKSSKSLKENPFYNINNFETLYSTILSFLEIKNLSSFSYNQDFKCVMVLKSDNSVVLRSSDIRRNLEFSEELFMNFDSEKKLDLEDIFDLFQSKYGGKSFKLVVSDSFKNIYNDKKDYTQDSFKLNFTHPENSTLYFYKYSNPGVVNFIYNNISKFSDCIDFTNLCMYRFSMKRLKQSFIKYLENASMDMRVKETLVIDEYSDDPKDYFLLIFLSKLYFELGDYVKAIFYSEKFYKVYGYFQNSIVVKSFFRIEDYGVVKSLALDMLNFEENIDVTDLRDICNTLSEVYFLLGDYLSSIKYSEKLFSLFEKHQSNQDFIYDSDSLAYINDRYYFSKILSGDIELIKYKDHINKRNFLVFFKYFLKLKNPKSSMILDNIISNFNVKRKKVL